MPSEAANFVIMIERFSQFFDDIADGEEVSRDDLDLNVFNCMVGLNNNSFFLMHRTQLLPVMELIILKWQASDQAERAGEADEKSFVWRAGFYDLLMAVVAIVHGHQMAKENAKKIMQFYAETMESYRKEFPNV